jgi:hypothetical protein
MTISIKQYYQAFGWVKGALVSASILFPIIPKLFSGKGAAAYLFPPLGDGQDMIMTATCIALAFLTYFVFRYCQRFKNMEWTTEWIVFGFSLLVFVILNMAFVKHVWFGTVEQEVFVSVGFERTALAKEHFSDQDSDLELLHRSGTDENIIEKLWTFRSIVLVRFLLWLSYTTLLGTFVWVISSMAYQHAVDEKMVAGGASIL